MRWNREAVFENAKHLGPTPRPCVFPSLCDPFDDEVPLEWLADFLDLIRNTPNLDYLLLTKRPQNIISRCQQVLAGLMQPDFHDWLRGWGGGIAPNNIWLGVSVENQATADERIPLLLKIPAALRFVSYEPALGPVDFGLTARWCDRDETAHDCDLKGDHLHWLIVGGESGQRARPCHIEWLRSAIAQCRSADVACFFKQVGAHPIEHGDNLDEFPSIGERGNGITDYEIHLSDKKGGDPAEWPEDLRVREFPRVRQEVSA